MIFAGKEAASSFNPFCSSPTSISSSSSSSPSYSSSSSSSSLPEWRYDVFLSFRGLDTRHNFSDHLYTALKERGVKVFRDDKKLGKGRIITRTIFRAIEESKFSIVVFSRNYACSEWCLDELAKIIECMNEKGHVAFPIFYHVPPDDVMNQIGHYEEAFLCHQRLFKKQRVQRWRIALTEIAGISGWDVQNYRSDSKLIKSIVRKISWNLRCTSPSTGKQLVPLSSTIKEINLYLYEGLDKTYIVRICGMDGMSSTTIGRVVYDAVIRQKWELFRFQELVSEMPRECSRNIWDADRVINVIRSKRQHKKVLVLLDDLDNLELVASLLRKHGWFIQGSRIVISARTPNKTILNVLDIRFGEPQGRENLFDASFNKAEKANNSMFLDIACFLKEMDDDHITRIVQSLVSGDLQAKSGTKFLISKSLIDISDNEYLLPLQDLSKKYFSQKNLEETRSHEKFWDMAGIHRLIRFDGASSQSNGKTENEPMKGLSTDKFKIQHQNLVGNGVSGKDTSSLHNLAREPVKERENAACVVPLELRSSGISEASVQQLNGNQSFVSRKM
ncbi:disease resistance protein RPV1 [Hevea brasiliensis]|uniref:disease resistance protein RPV1 n=1 Tax=Hevea brasiliensis TaxID=3981 RepID=UPI0025CE3C14|nr:disease resistance protein RPV1 [Hevea brasiliensis]